MQFSVTSDSSRSASALSPSTLILKHLRQRAEKSLLLLPTAAFHWPGPAWTQFRASELLLLQTDGQEANNVLQRGVIKTQMFGAISHCSVYKSLLRSSLVFFSLRNNQTDSPWLPSKHITLLESLPSRISLCLQDLSGAMQFFAPRYKVCSLFRENSSETLTCFCCEALCSSFPLCLLLDWFETGFCFYAQKASKTRSWVWDLMRFLSAFVSLFFFCR